MHQRKPLSIILLVMLLLMGATSIASAKDDVIRFAFQDRIGSVIPIVAETKGYFAKEGLTVKALRFSSGPACAEALYSGAADIGAMGDTTAIITTTKADKFVIIASHATGEHRHRIMVRSDSPLKTLTDLKGKRLAVKKGTSTYGGLLAVLDKADIPASSIDIINLTPPTMATALLAGSIDAFAASEPTPSAAEENGARELTTLGGVGNEYPILTLINTNLLKGKNDVVIRFVKALKEVEVYAKAHPDETAAIMAKETGLRLETTIKAMARHQYSLRLDAPIMHSLEQTALFLKGQNIIQNVPYFTKAADKSYLQTMK